MSEYHYNNIFTKLYLLIYFIFTPSERERFIIKKWKVQYDGLTPYKIRYE